MSFLSGEEFKRLEVPMDTSPHTLAIHLKNAAVEDLEHVSSNCDITIVKHNAELTKRTCAQSIFGDMAYLFMQPKGYKRTPEECVDAWLFNPFRVEWRM